ncbi:hypothetical protein [Paenibacillus sp. FSL M7-0896]|uniref:hypothetical protein n=1 Tax=Paenibacillus sp. FSL M7-0896 TaxID=2921610 RepID=UPI0030DB2387
MHLADTDRIYGGLLKELEWENKKLDEQESCGYLIEDTTVGALASFLKQRTGMKVIQIVGNTDTVCSRIGILVEAEVSGLAGSKCPWNL